MKTIPEMTKDLESQLTRQIRAFERVTGMQVGTVHLSIIGCTRAMSEATISLRVDDRPVNSEEFDPLATEDV